MKLYTSSRAPNARRVAIFLAEKGINDLDVVEVDIEAGENTQPGFLKKHPMAKIPVLELDDGDYIAESMAICRYFDVLRPSEHSLFGDTAHQQAKTEMWQRLSELYFLNLIGMCFQHTTGYFKDRMTPVPEWGKVCGQEAIKFFAVLDEQLSTHDYVAGDSFSVADITALCAIDFARVIKIKPEDRFSNLSAWLERVKSRPSTSFK